jgi:PKD repeat protein
MKRIITIVICCLAISLAHAQSSYISTNYASTGDTFYLTKASGVGFNFDTTGANITWNYTTLVGTSQRRLLYRAPNQTGFTTLQWPYINNASNVNLSSTDQQAVAIGGITETNPNDYYLKSTSSLQEKASSYNIAVSGISVNVKNVYATPDVIYKFPINYNNADTSNGSYTTQIPGLYYDYTTINRIDSVNGWGTIKTPYGTFSNCLKLVSNVIEIDTFSIAGIGIPQITNIYREYKWFDPSKKYQVLYVKQSKVGNNYVTQTVEYFDVQQYFQPHALFAYFPLTPTVTDTVTFQNLSNNAIAYSWNFADASSSSNIATSIDAQHRFLSPGTYNVKLVAYNGPLSDSTSMPVIVGAAVPVQLVSFTGYTNKESNLLQWSTSNQTNSSAFLIERSFDGIHFSSIGNIAAAGNSTITINYTFSDDKVNMNYSYYRLQILDKDGSATYSNIILIKRTLGITFKVAPNPIAANHPLTISINSDKAFSIHAKLVNIAGQIILQNDQKNIIAGENQWIFNIPSLLKGNYFIQFTDEKGNVLNTSSLICE